MKTPTIILSFLIFAACGPKHYLTPQTNLEVAKLEANRQNTNIFVIFDLFGSSTHYVDDILADEAIQKSLRSFVVVRLMCDDRRMLNDSISIGKFNSDFQIALTGKYYQPMFCFLNQQGDRIAPPMWYSEQTELLEYIQTQTTAQKKGLNNSLSPFQVYSFVKLTAFYAKSTIVTPSPPPSSG